MASQEKERVRFIPKIASWFHNHKDEIVEGCKYGLMGYGLGSLALDVSGIRRFSYNLSESNGYLHGYDAGFREGQQTAAELIATSQGHALPEVK